MKQTDCFIAFTGQEETREMVLLLNANALVNNVFVISPEAVDIPGSETLLVEQPLSTKTMKLIAKKSSATYSLLALRSTPLQYGQFAISRLFQVAENTEAAMVYADYREVKNGEETLHPVIDYQKGSLRDDFNFGPVQFFRTDVLKSFSEEDSQFAGYYALRLHASRLGELIRIPEFLFTMVESDTRKSGEKQFDYVSASAREKQIEMEEGLH
jgi:hypothetical protein